MVGCCGMWSEKEDIKEVDKIFILDARFTIGLQAQTNNYKWETFYHIYTKIGEQETLLAITASRAIG